MEITAMQKLIEWCNNCLTDLTLSDGAKTALEVTIVRATDLLEKEKEQIKESFEDGISEATNEQHGKVDYNMDAEEYYNQKYNDTTR
jgi:hypothetical protein